MLKISIISAFIGCLFSLQNVRAADLLYQDPPVMPLWTGFYVGGHIGGLWDSDGRNSAEKRYCYGYSHKSQKCYKWGDWKKIEKVEFKEDDDNVSLIGGIHMGYNWQVDSEVFGIEGDVSFADDVNYMASLRGVLGHALDNGVLIYLTAGAAFADFDGQTIHATFHNRFDHAIDFSGDQEIGLVAGGGIQYKLASNISIGFEGLYYAFGDNTDTYTKKLYKKEIKITHEDDLDRFVVRGRLSYHFDEAYEAPLK